jgi:hypothetical protein
LVISFRSASACNSVEACFSRKSVGNGVVSCVFARDYVFIASPDPNRFVISYFSLVNCHWDGAMEAMFFPTVAKRYRNLATHSDVESTVLFQRLIPSNGK